jgi:hypothetical protein
MLQLATGRLRRAEKVFARLGMKPGDANNIRASSHGSFLQSWPRRTADISCSEAI